MTQFEAWNLDRGQNAYAPLTAKTRQRGDPCVFVWTDLDSDESLTVAQAAYKIQQSCLDVVEKQARSTLNDAGIADTDEAAVVVWEKIEQYRLHWCAASFRRRAGEPPICCDGCGVELTALNCLTASTQQGWCVLCGEAR